MRSSGVIICVFFLIFANPLVLFANELPTGYEGISFGMTGKEVTAVNKNIRKADGQHHFSFGEHFEVNPNVYILELDEASRAEYYLFKNRVYKIFIIIDEDKKGDRKLYEKLVTATRNLYGEPKQRYVENNFNMQISHTRWHNQHTILDLRKGAGFVFKVIIDKQLNREKQYLQKMEGGV